MQQEGLSTLRLGRLHELGSIARSFNGTPSTRELLERGLRSADCTGGLQLRTTSSAKETHTSDNRYQVAFRHPSVGDMGTRNRRFCNWQRRFLPVGGLRVQLIAMRGLRATRNIRFWKVL